MRGLLIVAIVLSAVAGGVTIALGGVEVKHEEEEKAVAEFTGGASAPEAPPEPEQTATRAEVGATVRMRQLAFLPSDSAVAEGEAVRFVNRDNVVHNVVAETGSGTDVPAFDSNTIPPGGEFRVTPRAGTYLYVCTFHPTVMNGRIAVDAS